MKTLLQSQDSGALYLPEHVDSEEGYTKIEVPDVVTLTAEQLCGGYGNIVEILLHAKQAKVIN